MDEMQIIEFCKKLKTSDKIWYDSKEYNKVFGRFMVSDSFKSTIEISGDNLNEMCRREILIPCDNGHRIFKYARIPRYAILRSLHGYAKVIDSSNICSFEKKHIQKNSENIVSSTYIESIGKDYERCVEKIISLENGTINEKQFLSSEYEQHHYGPRPCALKSFIDILPRKVHDQVHSILTEYRRSETLFLNALNIEEFFQIVEYYDLRMQKLRDEFFGN